MHSKCDNKWLRCASILYFCNGICEPRNYAYFQSLVRKYKSSTHCAGMACQAKRDEANISWEGAIIVDCSRKQPRHHLGHENPPTLLSSTCESQGDLEYSVLYGPRTYRTGGCDVISGNFAYLNRQLYRREELAFPTKKFGKG